MIAELFKSLLYGIVEGITEWLPISSTGHLILLNQFVTLNVSPAFWEMFEVVIQLGAILAVVVLFFHRLNPFSPQKSSAQKRDTWDLWFRVLVGVIPSAAAGFFLDDWFNAHLFNYITVSIALIVYGILFIVIENGRRGHTARIRTTSDITYLTALPSACFRCSPGTRHFPLRLHHFVPCSLFSQPLPRSFLFMAIPPFGGQSSEGSQIVMGATP